MKLWARLLLASVCALLAGGATALIFDNRDLLFPVDWHNPSGQFRAEMDAGLNAASFALLARERAGATCVGQWIGKDEAYVYLIAGCARVRREGARLLIAGDQVLRPVRLRYDAQSVWAPDWLDLRNYENSLRRLFPRAAADLTRFRVGRALYVKLLREKLAGVGVGAGAGARR